YLETRSPRPEGRQGLPLPWSNTPFPLPPIITEKMLDLSFLTEEEYEKLMKVLQRDAELKKKDNDRIRRLQGSLKDEKKKKFVTGEWFNEVKAKRFQEELEGPDLLRASIRKKKEKLEKNMETNGELPEAKTHEPADNLRSEEPAMEREAIQGTDSPAKIQCRGFCRVFCCEYTLIVAFSQHHEAACLISTNLTLLPGQVSGSVLSVYSGDFGSVDAQGTVQFALDYDEKNREFQIYVSQCKDLAVVDEKKGRSDPYVKTYLLPDKARMGKRKTSVKKRTVNPIYNEVLRVRTFFEKSFIVAHLELTSPKNPSSGEVHIWVKDSKDLPQLRPSGVDSFVKCYVLPDTSKKSYQKTRVIKRDPNPVFNHTIVYDGFHTEDLKDACVELTVWDHEKLTNHFLGGIRLGLGTGTSYGISVDWMDSTQEEVAFWQEMMSASNEWIEGSLPLRSLAGRRKLK
uniref:Synaptotagmin like 2 n=1 Tax=Chelonoidis abingdonii TaxID=106734 RepID=A0A8C0J568_CHEAB